MEHCNAQKATPTPFFSPFFVLLSFTFQSLEIAQSSKTVTPMRALIEEWTEFPRD